MSEMDATAEVHERLGILELTARYADLADHQDWQGLTALFAPTAVFDARAASGGICRGHDEILDFYRQAPVATGHHPTGVHTTFEAPGKARSRLKMLVLFRQALVMVGDD